MANEFADLIPKNEFADLIPKNEFADLVPAKLSSAEELLKKGIGPEGISLEQQPEPEGIWGKIKAMLSQGENMEPGFLGTITNPGEIAAMAATGGISAARLSKPIAKEMIDWSLMGVPSMYKGVKGGLTGLLEGLSAKTIEKAIPVEKAMPINLPYQDYLWRTGEVGKKYLPAVIKEENIVAPFKLEKPISKPADIFPIESMKQQIGKDLKVIRGEGERGQVWNVVDDKNNTYGKLKISEFPDQKRLHVDFIELSKQPIKEQRINYEILQGVEKLPGVYSSTSKNIENYARKSGLEIITSNPVDMQRAKVMGYKAAPEGSEFTMWKRVNQKVDSKIIAQSGPLKELDGFASRRQLFFDQPKSGNYAFYDKEGFEIYRTKNIDEAQSFIRSYPLPQLTAKKADELYKSTVLKIQENSRKQEVLNKYKIEDINAPDIQLSYRKFMNEDVQKIAAETKYLKGESILNSRIKNPPPGTTAYSVGEIIKQRKEGMVPIHEAELEALKNIKEPKLEWITGKGYFEPAQFTFEKAGMEAKELFLYPVNIGRKNSVVEGQNIMTEFKDIFKELNKNNWNRIGIYMESLDPIGSKTLHNMLSKGKIKGIPALEELSTIEQKAVGWFNNKYEELINRVNESRVLAGLKPVAPRENYHPLFRDLNVLDSLGYNVFHKDLDNTISQFIHRYSTYFKHAIERKGGTIPIEINAAKAFEMYLGSAMKHIHLTPPIAKGRELLKMMPEKWLLQDEKPVFYNFITKWIDSVAGQKAVTEIPRWGENFLGKLNKNITFAMLSYNLRSALIQPTSLLNTIVEVGALDAREGLVHYLFKGGGKEALTKSNVLAQRTFEESVTRAMQSITGKIGTAQKKVAKVGMKPLQLLDMETAKASWSMAYYKGKKLGLVEREAINFADDVVIKTQASGNIENLSPLQRTAMGRTISLFQTFTLNNWTFLARDVAGVGKNVSKTETVKKVATYLVGATALNMLFEDVLGTYSPFPTPIKAFTKALDDGEDIPTASLRAAKEVSELAPIIGGGLKYGSSPAGAAVDLITGITGKAAGKPILRTWEDMLASLAGIPGTAETKKIIKGVSEDMPIHQTLLGAAGRYEKGVRKVRK